MIYVKNIYLIPNDKEINQGWRNRPEDKFLVDMKHGLWWISPVIVDGVTAVIKQHMHAYKHKAAHETNLPNSIPFTICNR